MKTALPLRRRHGAGLCPDRPPAEVPRVVTDLPVVASLVQQVMGDLGQPAALLEAGPTRITISCAPVRPRSPARGRASGLDRAAMTPWLERASAGLAAGAATLTHCWTCRARNARRGFRRGG